MHFLVVFRMVPDVVEELEVAPGGKSLETEYLRMIASESDDHALEEALLLKERHGGSVTVVAADAPELDDALFSALAKGADRVVKITGAEFGLSTSRMAGIVAATIRHTPGLLPADLILTGTQAIDDLDGLIAPLLGFHLGLPSLGIVTSVECQPACGAAVVTREFPDGVRGQFEIPLPAVLGVQAAEKPPRYVPVAKVRAAMKSGRIEEVPAPEPAVAPSLEIVRMSKPVPLSHAEMLEGDPEMAAAELCKMLAGRGLL